MSLETSQVFFTARSRGQIGVGDLQLIVSVKIAIGEYSFCPSVVQTSLHAERAMQYCHSLATRIARLPRLLCAIESVSKSPVNHDSHW